MLEDWQKELLTVNRPNLVKDMEASKELFDELVGRNIISVQQVAKIQVSLYF